MGNPCCIAIINGPFAVPAPENSFCGHKKLFKRIGREISAGVLFEDHLEFFYYILPIIGRELGIGFNTCFCTGFGDDFLEGFIRRFHDHIAEHLHQSAIRIVDKPFIAGQLYHSFGGFIIQSNVKNRVHHARHGEFCATSTGNQQRIFLVTKFFTGRLFNGF